MENIIDEFINFEKNKITSFSSLIIGEYFDESIFNELLEIYINTRYYDYYEHIYHELEDNICERLRKKAYSILDNDDTNDDVLPKKVKENLYVFNYVLYLDDVKECFNPRIIYDSISKYRKNLLIEEDPEYKNIIIDFINDVRSKRKKFIDSFNSQDFNLVIGSTSKFFVTDTFLDYSINFPKLYSQYAIDRVFTTGSINEEKLSVEYPLVAVQVLKNIINGNFKETFMTEFALSLLDNKEKLVETFKFVDNDIFKNNVCFKVYYKDCVNYMDSIKDMIRDGYFFGVYVDDDDIKDDDFSFLDIFKYIIVSQNSKYCNLSISDDRILLLENS